MIRRAMAIAVILGLCAIGGCECLPGTCNTCVPPGCDPCDHECSRACSPCGPCGPAGACDPHPGVAESRVAETRASDDVAAALRSGDRSTRERAIEALAARESSVLPQIEMLLSDPDPNVRFAALQVLVRLRRDAWPSVYHVKWRLRDSDPSVRAEAAMVLGLVGKCGAEAVPDLICALNDTSPIVRYRVAVAFQHMGECAEPARSAIERASRCDRDGRVREAAKCALWKLDKASCRRSDLPNYR